MLCLFLTGVVIGSDNLAPYAITWTNATYGTNQVKAIAYDQGGATGTSAVVTVIVNAPPPNLAAPTIFAVSPTPGTNLTNLSSIQVTFSERVTGVNATDLLINNSPALSVTGSGSNYTFTVTQPPLGAVNVTWASGHGISDIGFPPLPFDETAPGSDVELCDR